VTRQRVDPFAHYGNVRMLLDHARHFSGEAGAVDGQRGSGGDTLLIARAHDQRAERAHLLVEQPDRIILRVVGTEAIRAHHFGESGGLVRRSAVSTPAHFAEAHAKAGLGQLPCGFGSGEPAADDVDVEGHAWPLSSTSRRVNA